MEYSKTSESKVSKLMKRDNEKTATFKFPELTPAFSRLNDGNFQLYSVYFTNYGMDAQFSGIWSKNGQQGNFEVIPDKALSREELSQCMFRVDNLIKKKQEPKSQDAMSRTGGFKKKEAETLDTFSNYITTK